MRPRMTVDIGLVAVLLAACGFYLARWWLGLPWSVSIIIGLIAAMLAPHGSPRKEAQ